MDFKIMIFISFCAMQYVVDASLVRRNMTDCWYAGLKCSSHSNCNFDSGRNNFTCVCVAGFKGDLCEEDRNECDIGSAPCKKRGVCHNSVGSFRCDCLPGWQGSHCQYSDGSGLSTCLTGYTGVNCTEDFDECTQWIENPCEHGSSCINTVGNFTCSCVTGWEGRICNEDINECNLTLGLCHNGGNCTNIPGSYRCVCPYPYTGPACDDVSSTTSTSTTTTTTTTTPTPITSTKVTGAVSSVTGVSPGKSSISPGSVASTQAVGMAATSTVGKVQLSSGLPTTISRGSTQSSKQSTTISTNSGSSSNHSSRQPSTLSNVFVSTSAQTHGQISFGQTLDTVSGVPNPTNGQPTGPTVSNNTSQKQTSGKQNDSSGGTNTGAIVGPIVGVFVIAGASGAGYFVYSKYYRKHPKVDPANNTTTEKARKQEQTNEANRNTKFKPQETNANTDIDPSVIGIETTP